MTKFKSVLIIDDDTFNLILLERVFKKNNLAEVVFTALDGAEGLDKIKYLRDKKLDMPEMVLLDINMPVMNGIEFLKQLSELDLNPLPFKIFIMLTTALPDTLSNRITEKLVTANIEKPLSAENIRNMMEAYF